MKQNLEILKRTDSFGVVRYCNQNEKLHREDAPAVEYNDGTKFWYIHGKLHREDGPAVEYPNGTKHWYLKGKGHSEESYYREVKVIKLKRALNL